MMSVDEGNLQVIDRRCRRDPGKLFNNYSSTVHNTYMYLVAIMVFIIDTTPYY